MDKHNACAKKREKKKEKESKEEMRDQEANFSSPENSAINHATTCMKITQNNQ